MFFWSMFDCTFALIHAFLLSSNLFFKL